ncbi:Mn2+ and Fe2+ transporters of the NRAMP family [Marinactinospora thermotolerans DSM 45154]|uniref:Mn2+ and Fe2+ transporters of the NRAMP family n=1 Tax=Marinactinospora thermotolerans DSM 45154 TaxID=1122192 RepID=A0A1T4K847_9ACTN|nr:divalent metal cation transporter [Marinactinospora thermotolerans]SJZ38620.1 Mn2+ and Fe2+ transporters of the NRAMP family [Marinactinospora thermotolerans DSM 45154]
MNRLTSFTLGFLTAIGGFLDIGDIVANSLVGARFGMSLAWVIPVGVIGVCLFSEMAGRVTAVSGRPVFDLVRERLGARAGLANLLASSAITLLVFAAEIGGVALALELASSVHYLLWVPVVGFLVWAVIWRLPFERMERTYGLLGLAMVVFAVALWRLGPDWGALWHDALSPAPPSGEDWPTWWYYAIAVFGAAMSPYAVVFFSSGGVEERWSARDLTLQRLNVFFGFPLGGLLALSLMAGAAVLLHPAGIQVDHLSQATLPVVVSLGKVGLVIAIVGFFACTFGAALEAGLATGYGVAQYFGWSWGKSVRPVQAARFHTLLLATVLAGTAIVLTTLDPVKVTEYAIVLSAAALPLTYLPIFIVANDRGYLGDRVNSRFTNIVATVYLFLVLLVAAATLPLMLWTKAGQ